MNAIYTIINFFHRLTCRHFGHVMTPWEKDRRRTHARFVRHCTRCGDYAQLSAVSPPDYHPGTTVKQMLK